MNLPMLYHIPSIQKAATTNITNERHLTGMTAHVHLNEMRIRKLLMTHRTLVWLLTAVNLHVTLQNLLALQHLTADIAWK